VTGWTSGLLSVPVTITKSSLGDCPNLEYLLTDGLLNKTVQVCVLIMWVSYVCTSSM